MPFIVCVGDEIQYPAYTLCLPTLRNTPAAPQIVNVTVSQTVNHAFIKNRILVPQTDLLLSLFNHHPTLSKERQCSNLGHKHFACAFEFL